MEAVDVDKEKERPALGPSARLSLVIAALIAAVAVIPTGLYALFILAFAFSAGQRMTIDAAILIETPFLLLVFAVFGGFAGARGMLPVLAFGISLILLVLLVTALIFAM